MPEISEELRERLLDLVYQFFHEDGDVRSLMPRFCEQMEEDFPDKYPEVRGEAFSDTQSKYDTDR